MLTAGRGHDPTWFAAQERLAALSTNSRQRVVAEATHASLLEDAADARITSAAIGDVVDAVRHSTRLR